MASPKCVVRGWFNSWQIVLRPIPRGMNRVADALAKLGISNSAILDICPTQLLDWVEQEYLRFISPHI